MRTKDTLNNLLKILNILYSGEYVMIKSLMDNYGISERTASRYLNEYLQNAGFLIEKVGRKFRLANKNPEITGVKQLKILQKKQVFIVILMILLKQSNRTHSQLI